MMSADQDRHAEEQNLRNWELLVASRNGDLNEVSRLISEGANVDVRNEDLGWTSMHLAARNGHLHILQHLVAAGARIDPRDKSHLTPLHTAAQWGQLEIVKALIEHGADVNARTDRGWTALHWAAMQGFEDIVHVLLDSGVNEATLTHGPGQGKTAAELAEKLGYVNVLKLLRPGANGVAAAPAGAVPAPGSPSLNGKPGSRRSSSTASRKGSLGRRRASQSSLKASPEG